MLKSSVRVFFTFLLFFSINVAQAEDPAKAKVKDAYTDWCTAIGEAKGNPAIVTKFYAKNAELLPTLSPKILINSHGGLNSYFKKLTSQPQIKCNPETLLTRVYGNVAINSGLYDFSYVEKDGEVKKIPARFTFVYKETGNQWLIVEHHSSILPTDTGM